MSADQAKAKFFETVNECFYSNKRCILFVTGKGLKKSNFENETKKLYHGKIKNAFLGWVNQKEIIQKILNVSLADLSHGGDGAFFVYLRKNKH